MNDKCFFDSNILLYLISNSFPDKKEEVKSLLKLTTPVISPQVVFECLNVSTKKFKYNKEDAFLFINKLVSISEFTEENLVVVNKGIELFNNHFFQPFDAKIVATALVSGCSVLYSEDMQHGFVIENKLRILNPFV